ncbi:Aste57867_20357 [Aphanomyces stellatus]|uniref:Aste57867_20357 protein n=1 Tax=Aphanomyces stellatus TaxID=120398 RepID=A0A485LFD0_9STRA|nr:hypothetical protein As57867_020291 [Aphanomyces stellatus]VFT97044.1 Aste57867_20357 [Aphanomyces stellatus]
MSLTKRTTRRPVLRTKVVTQTNMTKAKDVTENDMTGEEDTCSESDDESLSAHEELVERKLHQIKALLRRHDTTSDNILHKMQAAIHPHHVRPPVTIPRHLQGGTRALVAGKHIPFTVDMVCNIRRRRCSFQLPLVHEDFESLSTGRAPLVSSAMYSLVR